MRFEELVSKYTPKVINEAVPQPGVNPATAPQPTAGQQAVQPAPQAQAPAQQLDDQTSKILAYIANPANQPAIAKAVTVAPTDPTYGQKIMDHAMQAVQQPQAVPAQKPVATTPVQQTATAVKPNPAATPAGTTPANANPMKR